VHKYDHDHEHDDDVSETQVHLHRHPENQPPQIADLRISRSTFNPFKENLPPPADRSSDSSATHRHVGIVIPDQAKLAPFLQDTDSVITLGNPSTTPVPEPFLDPAAEVMARHTPTTSRTNTIDSTTSAPSPSQLASAQFRNGAPNMHSTMNGSSTSLHRLNTHDAAADREPVSATTRTPGSAIPSGGPSPAILQTAGLATPSQATAGLSGLVCNVHRTTGKEPPPLVGATTTVLGDKMYVFGGRRLSRSRPYLTADVYELDLIRRHWTKLDCNGDIPPPRYFHSMCSLGDTKLVCYGGMSPSRPQSGGDGRPATSSGQEQAEVVVMSDIHIFDVPTSTWMQIQTEESPQGRYAHCAVILPSSAVFSSTTATMSAVQHNPSSVNPNQGSIGVSLDGTGGAEMVVVGGQDSANHYIEQVSVFNLRSLKWTATNSLGRSCGAYRSVVAPLNTMDASEIGAGSKRNGEAVDGERPTEQTFHGQSSMLIYSNYNFLDVRLELQVRLPDGTLTEKPMHGTFSPPGLRFPNGGVINNHFVVSGTFLTSSKQEYALWALDLKTLTWSRIDAGGNIFSQGSWNRGVLWNRRNTFVILGNRRRSLVEDYNHRRINFSNICMVELEAFGLYDNPRRRSPRSKYVSVSAPSHMDRLDLNAGGRLLLTAGEDLGQYALGIREMADMDFLAITGERIPVNSRIVARRWGPYFNQLLRESTAGQENTDTATLRPATSSSGPSRNSSITITPSIKTAYSVATTLTTSTITQANSSSGASVASSATTLLEPPDPRTQPPAFRSRALYLPHTALTLQALVHYLYTSSLPSPSSPLCTPQILCSLLQIARPYQVDGLLEAIIERQHILLDGRNTAAIFNAAAMAAGGGSGVTVYNHAAGSSQGLSAAALSAAAAAAANATNANGNSTGASNANSGSAPGSGGTSTPAEGPTSSANTNDSSTDLAGQGIRNLRINTNLTGNGGHGNRTSNNNGSSDDDASSASTSASTSDLGSSASRSGVGSEREIWSGELSAVVGLQKRGLRGLMEGRRIREMGRTAGSGGGSARDGEDRVGLGIA
jgi:hypothetical protein